MEIVNKSVSQGLQPATQPFEMRSIRRHFPILAKEIRGRPLVYLDNAASTQKPRQVIDAMSSFYEDDYANIHRGVYLLSQAATEAFEQVRRNVQHFINAKEAREIVFVKGTTEATNLVASTYARKFVGKGDEILISAMEHHSNIVPWQMICEEKDATLRVTPINDSGEIILEAFEKALSPKTRLVAITHVSNALGTVNPLAEIVQMAHQQHIPVLVDGAQAASHLEVDVQALDCDFYAFSGHKLYGPTGIGVFYGKSGWLEAMPPYQSGGEMINSVSFEQSKFKEIPYKFEAGTPDITGVIGLGAAIDFVRKVGLQNLVSHEQALLSYATREISKVPGVRIIGQAKQKVSVLSFVVDGVHAHDVGTILDQEGIAIRAGHHCAQPLMERFGLSATARASLAMYNTRKEVDSLVEGLHKVTEIFG